VFSFHLSPYSLSWLEFPYVSPSYLEFAICLPGHDCRGLSLCDYTPFSGFSKNFADTEFAQQTVGCTESRVFRRQARFRGTWTQALSGTRRNRLHFQSLAAFQSLHQFNPQISGVAVAMVAIEVKRPFCLCRTAIIARVDILSPPVILGRFVWANQANWKSNPRSLRFIRGLPEA
jgi:hypothetical protein